MHNHTLSFLCLLGLNLISFVSISHSQSIDVAKEKTLNLDTQRIRDNSQKISELYDLNENEKWREVTLKVLESDDTPEESKQAILKNKRRIFVFKYPSDGFEVKGFISFTPNPVHHPLLILYRWGNKEFALMNPGVVFATYKDYTVVSSMLRGGISEGVDEFGGADVNDMNNLMNFIPQLATELGVELHPSCVFMMGPSRGGMQMFLTLARFPELQQKVNKIVALSAILDLHQLLKDRPEDMKAMLEHQFGLQEGPKGQDWIAKRDPLKTVPYLKKNLPILIVQGTDDNRVSLAEGHHMVNALEKNGRDVKYWEVPNGNHVLMNTPHIMNDIAHWLESNSPCMSVHVSPQSQTMNNIH